ncbi:LA virus GAG protein N-acetyltransferase [Pelomyxa schiedti]|nr:LA virus GAG protein N-acetyltransferase [Pelomyxa schiedti]
MSCGCGHEHGSGAGAHHHDHSNGGEGGRAEELARQRRMQMEAAAAADAARMAGAMWRIDAYRDDMDLGEIMALMELELSEPYSVFTYRYFIHNWPSLCLLARDKQTGKCVGAIVCKLDRSKRDTMRGYIAMLAVDKAWRKQGIGSALVKSVISRMLEDKCDEVVLETEVTNQGSLGLYTSLGFLKVKRLKRYYLNGVDAFCLYLPL